MSNAWFKFYPTDWRSDSKLRTCSLSARGLWMEMICVMHEADQTGYLLVNGKPLNEKQLSGLSGCAPKEAKALVKELEEAGVFSRTEDGLIFSRRIVRDNLKAEQDRANGLGGGNPKLKNGVNPKDKAARTPARAQAIATQNPEPDIRDNSDRTALPTRGAAAQENSKWFLADRLVACLPPENGWKIAVTVSPPIEIQNLISAGFDLETDILPVITEVAEWNFRNGRSIRSWGFFDGAIRDRKLKPRNVISMSGPPPKRGRYDIDWESLDDCRRVFTGWLYSNFWVDEKFGPKPDQPGCLIPDKWLAHWLATDVPAYREQNSGPR